jgi:nucleoside-diphosphate-sugar epimerase
VEGVDAVVHVAGIVKARRLQNFDQVNVQGTRNMVAAAVRRAPRLRRFVQVSSLAAVGPSPDGKPILDSAEPNPVSRYGRSKLESEQAVLAASDRMSVTVIRPPLIYGPRDKECLAFFTSIQRGVLPILGDGRNTLSLITGADCARACIQAVTADAPSGRSYLIDDGEIYVWREALAEIEKALGKRAWLRSGLPLPIVSLAAATSQLWGLLTNTAQMLTLDKMKEFRQRHWVCSGSNARRDLGWSPTTRWPAGVAQTLAWYRSVGWL